MSLNDSTRELSFLGIAQLTLAQLTIGANIVISKYLIAYFPIMLILSMRFFLGTLMLWAVVRLKYEKIPQKQNGDKFTPKDWLLIFIQALCGGFLFNVLMIYGLRYTSAIAAGIISSATPAVIVILSALFLKEAFKKQNCLAILIVILGLIVLSLGSGKHATEPMLLLGNMLVLLAVIPEAVFTVLAKSYSTQIKPLLIAFITNAFNTILFIPFAIVDLQHFNFGNTSSFQWFLLVSLALMSSVLFYVFWYQGLAKTTASVAALFTAIMPVSVAILSYLFLSELLNWHHYVGMFCVVLSIMIGAGYLIPLGKQRWLVN